MLRRTILLSVFASLACMPIVSNAFMVLGDIDVGTTPFDTYTQKLAKRCQVKFSDTYSLDLGINTHGAQISGQCYHLQVDLIHLFELDGKIAEVALRMRDQTKKELYDEYVQLLKNKYGQPKPWKNSSLLWFTKDVDGAIVAHTDPTKGIWYIHETIINRGEAYKKEQSDML